MRIAIGINGLLFKTHDIYLKDVFTIRFRDTTLAFCINLFVVFGLVIGYFIQYIIQILSIKSILEISIGTKG